MRQKIIIAASLCLSLAGCAATAPALENNVIPERGASAGYTCNADPVQSLIGQRASVETGTRALKESGAKTLRWIAPGTAVTLDYRQDRLNISYDAQMIIEKINCN